MKKFLLIVLILAAAGRAFPEGFHFGGYVNSGVGVFFPDQDWQKRPGGYGGSGDPFVRLVSPDAGAAGWRFQLNALYTNEEQDLGFNLALRAQDSPESAFFDHGYGWFTAFGDTVKVLGGKIDDDTFATRDLIFADDNGESYGLLTIFRPANLLRIGFGVYAGIVPSSSQLGPLDNGKYTVSLALTIPDAFRVTASYRNANGVEDPGDASFIRDTPDGSGRLQDSQVYAGIDMDAFRAIGLVFSFAGVINNLQDRNNGIARIFESLSYTGIKGLSLNLALWQAGAR
ncbi:MAG: hypothetical protein LBQ67_07765, partial [Treponema sp.]|nr:hypothetical protein [Treponema sp.]